MVLPWVSAENVHGTGTGGLEMDFSGIATEDEHAVDALIRIAGESPGEVSVVAIGPLTNIAMAAVKDPSFVDNVKELVVMGGSNNGRGNITAAAEFNFYVDPHAARVVFEAGFEKVTVVPWAPLTLNDAVFSRERLAGIEALDTTLSRFFIRVTKATLEFDEKVGIPGSTHPDSLAVAVLLDPDMAPGVGDYHVAVETDSPLTRGYAAMSWGVHRLEPNARVVEKADGERFYRYICDLFATETEPSRPFTNLDS